MQFLLMVYYRRELFQIKSLTWILDRALLVGHSRDAPRKEVVFELPTSRVYDLCQRAARRQQETGREQTLAIDLDKKTYTFTHSDFVMESVRSKLDLSGRITVSIVDQQT